MRKFISKLQLNYFWDKIKIIFDSIFIHKSGDETIDGTKTFSNTISGSIDGNAGTATKLSSTKDINISDADSTNTGTKISFDGSANGTIKLPSTIKASITGNVSGSSGSCTGNAATATKIYRNADSVSHVQGCQAGKALVSTSHTGYGAIWNAPTKNTRVSMATYPSNNDLVYLLSCTNADVAATTNTIHKSVTWDANNGTLTANTFVGAFTGTASGTAANVTGTVAIAHGGTGATSASAALSNLGAAASSHTHSYLPLSGGTITGNITATNAQGFKSKNTGYAKGAASASWTYYECLDKNGERLCWIGHSSAANKTVTCGFHLRKQTTTDEAVLSISYDGSGNVYTSAPTPATSDSSTKIATTAFVKAQGYKTGHCSYCTYCTNCNCDCNCDCSDD